MLRHRLLDDTFKESEDGNPISVSSVARMYPGIEMSGWTEQDSTTGTNLFDVSAAEDGILDSDNGAVKARIDFVTSDYIPVVPGETYSRSVVGANGNFYYDSDKVWLNNNNTNTPFVPPEGAAYVRFSLEISNANYSTARMNKGSSLLPYEPYTGGKASPSPEYPQEVVSTGTWNDTDEKWEYDIQITGKNVFDKEQFITEALKLPQWSRVQKDGRDCLYINNSSWSNKNLNFLIGKTISDKTYIFSYECFIESYEEGKNPQGFYLYKSDGTGDYCLPSQSVALNEWHTRLWGVNDIVRISPIFGGSSSVYFNLDSIQFEIGDAITEYEEPKELQTVTLQSERQFTKWDKLEKRNGQWGWAYKSNKVILGGNSSESWSTYNPTSEGTSFFITLSDSQIGYKRSLCDKYKNVNGSWNQSNKDRYNIYSDHSSNHSKYFRPPNLEVTTIEQWRIWLQNNPLTLWYETESETFTPLSSAEQESMNALHTHYPTTILQNFQNCNMSLTYKTRNSLLENLLDFSNITFSDCIPLSDYSIQSNIQDDLACSLMIKYLNDFIISNPGKTLTFSCLGNPDTRRITIVFYGTFESGETYKERSGYGNIVRFTIPNDIITINQVELRVNRGGSQPFTDTDTVITNMKLTLK